MALVLAGGGVTGAVYEMGVLRALDELLDRSMLDLDVYVGISGGAFVSSLLAAGFSPRDMYEQVASLEERPFGTPAAPLFRLGLGEFARRSSQAPRVVTRALWETLTGEGRNASDFAWSLFELLPAGLLDNSGVQEFLEAVFRSRGRTDEFEDMPRRLFVVAVDLDSAEAVAFGRKGAPKVPVSRAVQASTALPGLYRPVRIHGRDYVDGGVKKTAHINLAIQQKADLVICVNPIVPIDNSTGGALNGHLSNKGVTYVLDQVLRIALHGRMQYGMERYGMEHPDVDILLLQPTRDDMRMFRYNIMRYSARRIVAEHGYRSAVQLFRENRARYERVLAHHGIALRDPARVPDALPRGAPRSALGRRLDGSLDLLASRLNRGRG